MRQCAWVSREKLISGLPPSDLWLASYRHGHLFSEVQPVCNELTSSIPTLEFGPYKYLEL